MFAKRPELGEIRRWSSKCWQISGARNKNQVRGAERATVSIHQVCPQDQINMENIQ